MDPKRRDDFATWWEGGFPGAFFRIDPLEDRLRHAFMKVLDRIPAEAFAAFMEADPTIVCPVGPSAQAFALGAAVPPSDEPQEAFVTVLYFDPISSIRKSDAALLKTVAHEAAHVVLGHHRMRWIPNHSESDNEEAADCLSERWGFKRCYTKGELKKMRDQERYIRESSPNRRTRSTPCST